MTQPKLYSPAPGRGGMTQLHFDAYCGNLEGVLWCLKEGMGTNDQDERGYTPLHWVTEMAAVGGQRLEIVTALISAGADINMVAQNGETALSLARNAGSDRGDELARELLGRGAREL